MGKKNSQEMDERQGSQCLGHSNWTIWSLLSQFCSPIFPICDFYTGECQFLITPEVENEKKGFIKNGTNPGISVPGAFKMDHLQPVKQILS